MNTIRTVIGLLAYFAPVPRLPAQRSTRKPEKGERGALAFKESLVKFLEASGSSERLNDFTASLLLRGQDDRPLVPIFGRPEASRVSRLVPDGELARLNWDGSREQLCSADQTAYSDVTMDDCQFGKHLEWYLKRAR